MKRQIRGRTPRAQELGLSIIEIAVVISLLGIFSGIAVLNLDRMVHPADSGASAIAGFMKETRARALSSTLAYTIEPSSTRQLVAKFAPSCSDSTTSYDERLTLDLPAEVTLSSLSWSICFNSRGFPDGNLTIGLDDIYQGTKSIEVLLGGGVRIL